MEDLPYRLLAEGYFSSTQLVTDWVSTGTTRRDRETELLVSQAWTDLAESAQHPVGTMPSSRLCRLLGWHLDRDSLSLTFGPTDYRELIGTNQRHPELARSRGRDYLANATGACAVVATADDRLVVQRRRADLLQFPGWFHVCGGMIQPSERNGEVNVAPFEAIRAELWEELGIAPAFVADMRCLGLVEDSRTFQPELVFTARLNVPAARFARPIGDEHEGLLLLDDNAASLGSFLIAHAQQIVPVGLACLLRYGRRCFGPAWAEATISAM